MTPELVPGGGDPADDRLRETVTGSRVVHRGAYIEVRVDDIVTPDGRRSTRDIVGHPGAVAIVAIDPDERVLLVRQFRLAAGRTLLEIPAGTLDRAADGSLEDPDLAARRELEEETGYRAGSWRHLAAFWTAPGFATELMHLYMATDLTPADTDRLGPDDDERLELEAVPWQEAVAMAERGEIGDAKSLVGLLWLARERAAGATALPPAAGGMTTSASPPAPAGSPEPGAGRVAVARTRLTLADRIRVMATLARMSRATLGFGIVMLILGVYFLADPEQLIAAIVDITFAVALLTGYYCIPFLWWQARRRPDLVDMEMLFEMDSTGIRVDAPFGGGKYVWSAFRRVREQGGFFFLDMLTGVNIFVPVKAFDAPNLAEFRRLLRDAGLSSKLMPTGRPNR